MTLTTVLPTAEKLPVTDGDRTPASTHQAVIQSVSQLVLNWGISVFQPFIGGILLMLSLVGIAGASIFIVLAEQDLSPSAIAFDRLLIAAIAFSVWHRLQSSGNHPSSANATSKWRTSLLFLIAGVSFAASLTCSAWSLTQTTVANSALLNNMMPIFTTLGAWLFLGQRFRFRFVLGLLVAIAGVMAIGLQDLQIEGNQITGDITALLAAVLLATTILSIEQLRATFSTPAIMAGTCLIGCLAIIPVVVLSGVSVLPASWLSGFAVLALAIISQVIGHGLLTYSLKQFSSGLVSVSMLAIPIIAALLSIVLFGERLSLINGVAFLVVLFGIYLSISAGTTSQSNQEHVAIEP
jgi:drug/metabolite transporter (DMT)-like permease